MGERIADAGDDAVPLALFVGRIIDQDAMRQAAGEIAAVVPDDPVAHAGHDEEVRRHPFIDNA